MIAVDTSALIAMVCAEPESELIAARIDAEERVLIGAPTMLEFRMVAAGKLRPHVEMEATKLVSAPPFELVPFGAEHLESAIGAFMRFGKGRDPAGLNYGDCMSYAVAKVAACRLLYKGADFDRTDIERWT